jgi:hypothetical protein
VRISSQEIAKHPFHDEERFPLYLLMNAFTKVLNYSAQALDILTVDGMVHHFSLSGITGVMSHREQ